MIQMLKIKFYIEKRINNFHNTFLDIKNILILNAMPHWNKTNAA
jgi:hypothetical protein